MAQLYGKNWTKNELLQHIGHVNQVAGIKPLEAVDGLVRGSRLFEVWTGSGLNFRVLAERALDITACHYRGMSLAWMASPGEVHPAYYDPKGLGWLRSFSGGLLVTCGLDQYGSPNTDSGEDFGQHGRISNLPAESVNVRTQWVGNEYELEISGEVGQTRIFGENLVLRRRILTRLGSNKITFADTVSNEAYVSQPHMILYHFNLGFPLICGDTVLRLDTEQTAARDAEAESGLKTWSKLQPPTPGYREQVFRHTVKADASGKARVEIENPTLGVGLRLTYDRAVLPHLFQWKMMGQGTYVLGIEPGNSSGIEGRAVARQRNDLPMLEPGESRAYRLELEVFESSPKT
jgi:hypothetical protein